MGQQFIDRFGMERVAFVLANTVCVRTHQHHQHQIHQLTDLCSMRLLADQFHR